MTKIQPNTALLISSLIIVLGLSGCTTQRQNEQERQKIFEGSRNMKSILEGQQNKPSVSPKERLYRQAPDWSYKNNRGPIQKARYIPAGVANNEDYTRTERNELAGLFPRLPNPDLCMYVFPHLTAEKATVPGYTSCFPMYETNQYALPGEMSATWQTR